LKHEEKGRRQTALPPEKLICLFGYLSISALVRPDSSEYPLCWASAVAPSVLSCESSAMIFSLLLFCRFANHIFPFNRYASLYPSIKVRSMSEALYRILPPTWI